jgi:hypothetical protein
MFEFGSITLTTAAGPVRIEIDERIPDHQAELS